MATDLTAECLAGYAAVDAATVPHLWSSPAWLGFRAGQVAFAAGHTHPKVAGMSRGYSVNVRLASGQVLKVTFSGRDLEKVATRRED